MLYLKLVICIVLCFLGVEIQTQEIDSTWAEISSIPTVGIEGTTGGIERTTVGIEGTTVGIDRTTVAIEGTTVGIEGTTVGIERTTLAIEETTTMRVKNSTIYYETSTVTTSTNKPFTTIKYNYTLDSNTFELNSSVVIVWEKCGLEARTQITQIFKSVYSEKQVVLSYDPSINVLIYESTYNSVTNKQVLRLPEDIAGELLFLLFNEPGKIHIYLDCPRISKNRFEIDFNDETEYLSIFNNTKLFASLDQAMETFKCRASLSVIPGTVLHFDGQLQLVSTALLISLTYEKEIFSLSLQNGLLVITSSASQQSITITLTQTITSSGLYLIFTETSLQFHVTCPISLQQVPAGYWNTTMFKSKLNIETSRHHYYGNAATIQLLNAFCSTNNINNIIQLGQTDCLSTNLIQSNFQVVDQANHVLLNFLPPINLIEQIDTFNFNNPISIGSLIENDPKLLIASRDYAQPEFFNKNLKQYVEGFSDSQSNFWIGLDVLNKVTSSHDYKLRVIATTKQGTELVEEYLYFKVANASQNYRLTVTSLSLGSNGFFANNNGAEFSTYDNDVNSFLARNYAAGYWHKESKYYCFSCVDFTYKIGTAVNVSLAQGLNVEVFKTKMYLLPAKKFDFLIHDSLIVTDSEELLNLLEFDKNDKFSLLYRGSRDGFTAKAFHNKCDYFSKTLTIVKSGSNIFGGYTEQTWDSNSVFKKDINAFLFSLKNTLNTPVVMRASNQTSKQIFATPSYGPSFSGYYQGNQYQPNYGQYINFDLVIYDQSNRNTNSYSALRGADYFYNATLGPNILGGTRNFEVNEIEVYLRFI